VDCAGTSQREVGQEYKSSTKEESIMTSPPVYSHSCPECRFVKSFTWGRKPTATHYDLYVCQLGRNTSNVFDLNVLLRYGNDSSEYESMGLSSAVRIVQNGPGESLNLEYIDWIYLWSRTLELVGFDLVVIYGK